MRKYILVYFMLLSHAAWAMFETGNDLLSICEDSDAFGQGACRGFIMGVSDMSQEQPWYCKPRDLSDRQLVNIIIQSLNEHPDDLYNKPHSLVQEAFLEAFPCK